MTCNVSIHYFMPGNIMCMHHWRCIIVVSRNKNARIIYIYIYKYMYSKQYVDRWCNQWYTTFIHIQRRHNTWHRRLYTAHHIVWHVAYLSNSVYMDVNASCGVAKQQTSEKRLYIYIYTWRSGINVVIYCDQIYIYIVYIYIYIYIYIMYYHH